MYFAYALVHLTHSIKSTNLLGFSIINLHWVHHQNFKPSLEMHPTTPINSDLICTCVKQWPHVFAWVTKLYFAGSSRCMLACSTHMHAHETHGIWKLPELFLAGYLHVKDHFMKYTLIPSLKRLSLTLIPLKRLV